MPVKTDSIMFLFAFFYQSNLKLTIISTYLDKVNQEKKTKVVHSFDVTNKNTSKPFRNKTSKQDVNSPRVTNHLSST